MASNHRVSLVQYAPDHDSGVNLGAVAHHVQQAADSGASLVVFPEYSHSFAAKFSPSWVAGAQGVDGAFVSSVVEMSVANGGITIVVGMLAAHPSNEKPANTMVAIGAAGVEAAAEKIHLYDAFGANESSWIRPGSLTAPQLFSWGEHRVGMMACYDLRFPEVTRRLVDGGATVVVVPAQWVPGDHKTLHWETLLRARAIEAQVFVVAVNHPMPHGVGHSQVIDPWGDSVVCAGEAAAELVAHLDPELVHQVRGANPMAHARRFGVIEKS